MLDTHLASPLVEHTPNRETGRLVASDRVEGTAVYNFQGEHMGAVRNFVVDKASGRVAYAVMSFGDFLGTHQRYHPIPWQILKYDDRWGGFIVDLNRHRLENAPNFRASQVPNWSDQSLGDRVDQYYGVPSFLGEL